MIIKENVHDVTTSGLEEAIQWTVSESSFLFDLLGKSLYKNPQKAVCREYFTNAADANIEGNHKNKPIEVNLPTFNVPYLVVKDYGIGIGPTRATELYTRLGESSKRNTNKQAGCLGIGRVSFMSMSDQMTVETVFEGRKYLYIVYKGQNGIPQLTSENYEGEPTTELSGTKITIPIKSKDVTSVASEGLKLFRFFPVKPICNLALPNYTSLFSTDTYVLDKNANTYYKNMYAVMGSIIYPIESNYTNDLADGYDLYLHFKIGEVSVEASREGLHYDDKTKKKIQERFEEFQKDIKEKLSENFKDLKGWELDCKKNEIDKKFNGLVDFKTTIKATKECGPISRFGHHKFRLESDIELNITPKSHIQWFIKDKEERFIKPLKEWGESTGKIPSIIENDKTKIDEVKAVFGLEDKDFLYTSMFKTVKTGKSKSVRGVTQLRSSSVKSECFLSINDEVEVKYYVIRKGFNITWNNNEYSTNWLLSNVIEHTEDGCGILYKGEPVYAVLPSQVKHLADDAVEVVQDSVESLKKSLTEDDLLAIVKSQQIDFDIYHYSRWNVPILSEAVKEISLIKERADKAVNKRNKLMSLGHPINLPTWNGTFKYQVIEKTPSILKYVSVPSNKNDKAMIESILYNQLRKGLNR